jgi:Protein of unknown function (DUF3349)
LGLADRVSGVIAFFRAGYPKWAPDTGYAPLLALLRRRVSDDEITAIATRLVARRRAPMDAADVGVEITRITDDLPSADDIARVQRRIDAIGRPDDRPDQPSRGG